MFTLPKAFLLSLILPWLITGCAPKTRAIEIPPSVARLAVSVDEATGTYKITTTNPAWTFAGSVGAPMSDIAVARGSDKIGAYQEITFDWNAGKPLKGAIRSYQTRRVVQFAITMPQASRAPMPDFPAFISFPTNLHSMSFEDDVFSPHIFHLAHNGTPWIFFDDASHTAVLSPASDFLVSQMHGDGKT